MLPTCGCILVEGKELSGTWHCPKPPLAVDSPADAASGGGQSLDEQCILLDALQLDVRGSTAVLLHACFHLQKDEYVFVFACTGDVEASSSALSDIKRLEPDPAPDPMVFALPGNRLLGTVAQSVSPHQLQGAPAVEFRGSLGAICRRTGSTRGGRSGGTWWSRSALQQTRCA